MSAAAHRPEPRLPDFIIIGTMKGGTTALHHDLGRHPDIATSATKELDFFIEGPSRFSWGNWDRGLDWYKSHFRSTRRLCGEASPNYTNYPRFPDVPARMHGILPQAKLIYVVRHPVERVLSHWVHRYAAGREALPFQEALESDADLYLQRSCYALQLRQFLAFYPRDQVFVTSQERLLARRAETLQDVVAFLGVSKDRMPRPSRLRHESRRKRRDSAAGKFLRELPSRVGVDRLSPDLSWGVGQALSYPFSRAVPRPVLSDALRAQLLDHFRDDVRDLHELTGRTFSEWGELA